MPRSEAVPCPGQRSVPTDGTEDNVRCVRVSEEVRPGRRGREGQGGAGCDQSFFAYSFRVQAAVVAGYRGTTGGLPQSPDAASVSCTTKVKLLVSDKRLESTFILWWCVREASTINIRDISCCGILNKSSIIQQGI